MPVRDRGNKGTAQWLTEQESGGYLLEFKSPAPSTKSVAAARFLFNCKFPQVKCWLLVSLLLGWREAMWTCVLRRLWVPCASLQLCEHPLDYLDVKLWKEPNNQSTSGLMLLVAGHALHQMDKKTNPEKARKKPVFLSEFIYPNTQQLQEEWESWGVMDSEVSHCPCVINTQQMQ